VREEFIRTYEENFDENRLLCLAQAYTNVILLGCRYPEPVMRQVNEMAKGLQKGSDIREAIEAKNQVNFRKETKRPRTEELGTNIGGGGGRPRQNQHSARAANYF